MITSVFNKISWSKMVMAGCIVAITTLCLSFSISDDSIGLKVSQKEGNILVDVTAQINSSKSQFYIFNMDSELVKQYEISGSKLIVIPRLKKGIYLYEFFSNDARLKNGRIELK